MTTPDTVTASLQLAGPDWRMQAKVAVPAGPIRLRQLLPMVQSVANGIVDATVQAAQERGERISCKKGCGACCRQLVPISEVEARRIREVVEELPEPRRSEVRARFDTARLRLENAGLLDMLLHPDQWLEGEGRTIGLEYFRQGIPCPFLEEESCSIYEDRPVACREYLVTSPAENCARPTAETVKMLRMPLKIWTAFARLDEVPAGARFIRWVPLILAPAWAEAHADDSPTRPGPEWLRSFFEKLTGKDIPSVEPPQCGPVEDSTIG